MYPPIQPQVLPSPNEGKPPTPEASPTGASSPANSLVALQYTPEFIKTMFEEIQRAQARRDEYAKDWDILLKEYIPEVSASGTPESVKTNAHFRNVHTKLAQIFYQLPELMLEPRGPMRDPIGVSPITGQPITAEDAVAIKREVLNFKLGEDGIDASWLMDEVLTDCLLGSGYGAVKVYYKSYSKPVQEPVMIPDPSYIPPPPQMGSVLGLSGPPTAQPPMIPLTKPNAETGAPEPVMRTTIVPIYEEWCINRIPGKKVLFADNLRSGRVDRDACWVGMEFFYTAVQMKSCFQFDPEVNNLTATGEDTLVADNPREKKEQTKKYHGYELWIRACEYDPAQPHPLAVYQLVLLEGYNEKPIVYRPSPDQTFDEFGRLTVDSMIGFPIDICTLRDMPDSPFVYSDAAMVNNQIKQMNTHRQQSVALRDAAIAKMLYDKGAFTPEEIQRIKNMKVGDWYGVEPGLLASGKDSIVVQANAPTKSRDDNTTAATIKQDMDEALGISAAEAGVVNSSSDTTATEVASAAAKANTRLGKDQQRATKFYLRIVRKFDSLLMRYATADDYIQIVGALGEKRMEVWNNKIISGPCAYRMKPDSQLRIDAARDRQQLLSFYKETQADPMINRGPIVKKIARLFGLDPAEVVLDPAMMALMQASGANSPQAPGTGPAPAEPGVRPHLATGGRPNQPEPGTGATPNVPRAIA